MNDEKIKKINKILFIFFILICVPACIALVRKNIPESQPTNDQINSDTYTKTEKDNMENKNLEFSNKSLELYYNYTETGKGKTFDYYKDDNNNEYGFYNDKLVSIMFNCNQDNQINKNDINESVGNVISNYINYVNIYDYELTEKDETDNGYDLIWTRKINNIETYDTIAVSVDSDENIVKSIDCPLAGTITDQIINSIEVSQPSISEQKAIEIYKDKFYDYFNITYDTDIELISVKLRYNEDYVLTWEIKGTANQKTSQNDDFLLTYYGWGTINATDGEIIEFYD